MTRSLRRDHRDVNIGCRLDQAEVNVKAVREHQHGAALEIRLNICLVAGSLLFIRNQNHDDIRFLHCFRHRLDGQALCLCLGNGLGAGIQADHNIHAGILQIQRMCMALAAISDDSDLLALQQRHVAVFLVVDSCLF